MIEASHASNPLSDRSLPLARVLGLVDGGERALADATPVKFGISANVIVDLLGVFLRREALLHGVRLDVHKGEFDDFIGDLTRFAEEGVSLALLIPYFDNFLPAFEARVDLLDDDIIRAKLHEVEERLGVALTAARNIASVQITTAFRMGESTAADGRDRCATVLDSFNDMLRRLTSQFLNVQLIDAGSLVAQVGHSAAFDMRYYLRSKAPFSPAFLSALAARSAQVSRGFGSLFIKALVLDCDNTLWGGIIGEDLIDGIRLDPFDYPGNVFWRAQARFASIEKAGILLCLCSKNNSEDVDHVFRDHPGMLLRSDQITARRVNWHDKVSQLQDLANELNIGLDDMVFVDDNPVEVEGVRQRLPMLHVFQVPPALPSYEQMIDRIAALCLIGRTSATSANKTEQYRTRAATTAAQAKFATHEDYLQSLDLELAINLDVEAEVPRISELSMKSNQFNLTTLRCPPGDVIARIANPDQLVVSLHVRNKFGDAGLTGVALLTFDGVNARVDNFLMSCRVLGQSVEFAHWPHVVELCRARGARVLEATFIPTAKNAQVRDFFDRLGMSLVGDEGGTRRYRQVLDGFAPPKIPHVRVSYV